MANEIYLLTGSSWLFLNKQGTAHIPLSTADNLLVNEGHLEGIRYHTEEPQQGAQYTGPITV